MEQKYLTLSLAEFLGDNILNSLRYVEVYNYVEQITQGFEYIRACLMWYDVRDYCDNRINKLSYDIYVKNGWDIPRLRNEYPNFEEMREKTGVGILSIPQHRVLTLIENKLTQKLNESDNSLFLPDNNKKHQFTLTIPIEILQALEANGCITQNPLEWIKSKSLLAYFAVGMCEQYNIKHGQNRILKPFEYMFNVTGLSGAINDFKKVLTPPAGYEIINEILKLPKKFFDDNLLNYK